MYHREEIRTIKLSNRQLRSSYRKEPVTIMESAQIDSLRPVGQPKGKVAITMSTKSFIFESALFS